MNIGVFSGSFNPIHIGHVILANYIVEFTEIDEVWFLVSPQNPLKDNVGLLDEKERFRMAQLALEGYSRLKASDFELFLPKPSYTINTLEALQLAYPANNFMLIIGADNWSNFEEWKDYDKMVQEYPIKVYPRVGYRITIPTKLRQKVEALESPVIEISSTFIRESIAVGKNIKAFLPDSVYEYIEKNKLYR
ncbi:nicotinate (nicotinamide) nucleotide adenylyltransferase [Dysgonomonas sp. ZJ709]|uniref:nicotinate (nicotinamide) nucleotide adenylyltransferase n=1 Tax=Dysgonomonas sp. ZJ709 TaxID=2709797 RepID=UPI0013EBA669|nr:nicotinate (nicotinamide) nucleotide adenylyltransferase [Dysgonomonas sp. ZJ709]